jgi:hypothetical protein
MKKKNLPALFFIFFAASLQAQTWDGSASTDWNTAANWSTNAVPLSTGSVVIPGTGITNWPVMAGNVTIGSITMNAGSQLNTAGFNITLTITAASGGCDITGAVVTNPVPANTTLITVPGGGTNINGSTFNGNFHFSTSSGNNFTFEASTAANTWNGNTTFTGLVGETLTISNTFASFFNGNLTINKPFDATDAAGLNALQAGPVINGNFTLNYDDEGGLQIGSSTLFTRISGQVNMNIVNAASSLNINGLRNQTGGGTITVSNLDVATGINQDSLVVSTFSISQTVNNTSITNSYIKADFTYLSSSTNGNNFLSLSSSVFDGNVNCTASSVADIFEADAAACTYTGNASFSCNGGTLIISDFDTSSFHRNLTVNTSSGLTIRGLKFTGSANSELTQSGTQPLSVGRLIMEKTGNARLTLNDAVDITTSVRFTSGNIYTTSINYLRFNNLINYTGGNNSSHVVGPVHKVGNISAAPFTFPVGGDNTLNPVTMSNHGSATDIFSAEYLFRNPNLDGYDTSQHAGALKRVSACEYWNVQRVSGASNVTLTFTFGDPCRHNGPGPLYITDPTKINIARWNGALWQDLGNGGSTGTTSGTVTTASPVSSFSPFTFGSTDLAANPLPITLLSFDAIKDNNKTRLVWRTTGEINFSHFEIERSLNGVNYSFVAKISAANSAGNHNYTAYDIFPAGGLNYYRLKMIDKDGRFTYSLVTKIDFGKKYSISILPNPANDYIIISGSSLFTQVQIVDVTGKVIKHMSKEMNNRYHIVGLPKGMYWVRLIGAAETTAGKLIIE